jgi:hypothetical protein
VTQLINNIHEPGEWSKYFTEFTISLKEKQEATKCSDQCTISLIAHIAQVTARRMMISERIYGEGIVCVFIEGQMALERVNWTKLMPIQRELISTRTRED